MPAILRDSELLIGRALGAKYLRENRTESYVSVPPALIITDSNGATWTLGFKYLQRGWAYYFNILRNDVDTGEYGSQIEYRSGRIRILTRDSGWKTWVERSPREQMFSSAPGYWV